DPCPFGGEPPCRCRADAAGRARDDCDPAFEPVHVLLPIARLVSVPALHHECRAAIAPRRRLPSPGSPETVHVRADDAMADALAWKQLPVRPGTAISRVTEIRC